MQRNYFNDKPIKTVKENRAPLTHSYCIVDDYSSCNGNVVQKTITLRVWLYTKYQNL